VSDQAPAPVQAVDARVSIRKSIALAAGVIVLLPTVLWLLWVAGAASAKLQNLISRLDVSWGLIGLGALVVTFFALLIAVIHATRIMALRALDRTANYENAAKELGR